MKKQSKYKADPRIKLGDKMISENNAVYIIAEVGSNHNRDYKQALKLIDVAKSAGADAVKFQTYRAETLYSRYAPRLKEMNGKVRPGITPFELIKSIQIPWQWHEDLKKYCEKIGIEFCSTPFDLEAVELLEKIGVKFHKIASSEIDDVFLLEKIAKTRKPIIISTGKANLEDVKRTFNYLVRHNSGPIALLHSVSQYPARYEDMNLRALITLKENFRTIVGLSDHTLDEISALGAVSVGARIIEKHITLDKKLPGPDHSFAMEPKEFSNFVSSIRKLEKALGTAIKKVRNSEKESRRLANRSIHALKSIPKGTVITKDMLCIKRPALGISPWRVKEVIGRVAAVDIKQDQWITKRHFI